MRRLSNPALRGSFSESRTYSRGEGQKKTAWRVERASYPGKDRRGREGMMGAYCMTRGVESWTEEEVARRDKRSLQSRFLNGQKSRTLIRLRRRPLSAIFTFIRQFNTIAGPIICEMMHDRIQVPKAGTMFIGYANILGLGLSD